MYVTLISNGDAPEHQILSIEVKNTDDNTSVVYDFTTTSPNLAVSTYNANYPVTASFNYKHITVSAAAAGASDTRVHYSPANKTLEAGIYKLSGDFKTDAASQIKVAAVNSNNAAITGAEFTVNTTASEWTEFEEYITVTEPTTFIGISVDGGNAAYGIKDLSFECISVYEDAVLHNLLLDGDCDTGIPAGLADSGIYTLEWDERGYVVASARDAGNVPVSYTPVIDGGVDTTHTYLFSFRIRTSTADSTTVRFATYNNAWIYPMIDDYTNADSYQFVANKEWQTVTIKIDPTTNWQIMRYNEFFFMIYGSSGGCQEYQLDGFTLIDVTDVTGTGFVNLITDGKCTDGIPEGMVDGLGPLVHHEDGYVITPDRDGDGQTAFKYTTNVEGGLDPTRTYRLSFSLRSGEPYTQSYFRFYNGSANIAVNPAGTSSNVILVPSTWTTYSFDVSPEVNPDLMAGNQISISIRGYMGNPGIFHIDDIKLIDITPSDNNAKNDNLIENGSFNNGSEEKALERWSDELPGARVTAQYSGNDRIIAFAGRDVSDAAVKFDTDVKLDEDSIYRLQFKMRTQDLIGEDTVRLFASANDGTLVPVVPRDNLELDETVWNNVSLDGEWQTIIININETENSAFYDMSSFNLRIYGSEDKPGFDGLFFDDISLVDVTPPDLGTPHKGLVMILLKMKKGEWQRPEPTTGDGGVIVYTNLIDDADSAAGFSKWNANGQVLEVKTEGDTEYVAASGITVNFVGFTYKSGVVLQPGDYKFSCKIRTAVKGETSTVRVYNPVDNSATFANINNDWQTLTFDMTVSTPLEFTMKVCGGMAPEFVQNYDISEITLIDKNQKATAGSQGTVVVSDNLIAGAVSQAEIGKWAVNGQVLEAKKEGDTEYVAASGITVNFVGFTYKSGVVLQPGDYKFTCKLRTSVKGDTSTVRVYNPVDNTATFANINNDWQTLTFDMTVSAPIEFTMKICGGMAPEFVQPYDISDISLIKVG